MPAEGRPANAGRASGLRQFVLKIHSLCNLECDYCYVYEAADQSWRTKPAVMSTAVIEKAATRIAEHVAVHRPPWIEVVLHGGEPLLAGLEVIEHAVAAVRAAAADRTTIRFLIQTNGVLLSERSLDVLDRLGVRVAVSLDGGRYDHDRHRRFRNGLGSYEATATGLRLLSSARYRHMFVGVLSVVDLASDPRDVWAEIEAWNPSSVDFLLPHRTWADPPPAGARYGSWLATVFDPWFATSPRKVSIRLFDEIIAILLGASTGTTAVGAGPLHHVTIESDGTVEADDILKIAYPGAPETGLCVGTDDFDSFLAASMSAGRRPGTEALCAECRSCTIVEACGGGSYPHRYRPGIGFANPSAYCDDLTMIIGHIRAALLAELSNPGTANPV